jgi:hypothetical protein
MTPGMRVPTSAQTPSGSRGLVVFRHVSCGQAGPEFGSLATALCRLIAASLVLLSGTGVRAQPDTSGAARGTVIDSATGKPAAGAAVIATSAALQGERITRADQAGSYYLGNLAPGTYRISARYRSAVWSVEGVVVALGKVTRVNLTVDSAAAVGEVIEISAAAPFVDQGSTKTGATITEEFTRHVPTGLTVLDALGSTPGAHADQYGLSFSGSTSLENSYVVEGLNTTDPGFGGALGRFVSPTALTAPALSNEFVRETEVITGGYSAEFGRSTGAVVNVATKSGSNQVRGSVFSYYAPGRLSPTPAAIGRTDSALARRDSLDHSLSLGAELGGPIICDKLWFHAGFNPVWTSSTVDRITRRFVDADNDGSADTDENGLITEVVDQISLATSSQTYLFHGKLTAATNHQHQGALSVFGNPGTRDQIIDANGPLEDRAFRVDDGAYGLAGRWTSSFANNAFQIDGYAGAHNNRYRESPGRRSDEASVLFLSSIPLSDFAAYEEAIPVGCDDSSPDDPYPAIVNCPVTGYQAGGLGGRQHQEAGRLTAGLKVGHRFRLGGAHWLKLGGDIEHQTYARTANITGGALYLSEPGRVTIFRFSQFDDEGGQPCGIDISGDGVGDARCSPLVGSFESTTATRNLSWFTQDSWAIRPNLSLELGLRWESQTLFGAKELVGQLSPLTLDPIPHQVVGIDNMVAPRLGLVYDWTNTGRSRTSAHWGRYYESIPMNLNVRSFGGEIRNLGLADPNSCADPADPTSCDPDDPAVTPISVFQGGSEQAVVPDLQGQYLDELIVGVEYEIDVDFKVGASYIRRSLGRIVEDVSSSANGQFVLANPGEPVAAADIAALRAEAERARQGGAMERAALLEATATAFAAVGSFDPPSRVYDGLQATVSKRLRQRLMATASYTWSRTQGNYPGLFDPSTGQLDPNVTSMYDVPELMTNRYGRLPQDHPHAFKLDGYYLLPVEKKSRVLVGAAVRAQSGSPISAIAPHPTAGQGQSYVLGRGAMGRSDVLTQVDARLGYFRQLSDGFVLESFIDVFNLLNRQAATAVDEQYTLSPVNPIVGGDERDLAHLKVIDPLTGQSSAAVAAKNPNFGTATRRQDPLLVRFGLRLRF